MLSPPSSPSDVSTDKDASIKAQVERERVAMMVEQTPVPVLAGIGFSVFLCWLMWPYMAHGVLLTWLALRSVASLARCVHVFAFRRADPSAPRDVARWKWRYIALMALDACFWGAMGVLFHPPGLPEFVGLMVAAVIGVSAIGIFTLGSVFVANMTFASLVVGPSLLFHAIDGTVTGIFSSGGLAIFFALLLFESLRIQTRTLELVRLRFENAWIAEERRRALLLAERSNSTKTRFLATISHELRTPLNGVLGMTQLLERSTLDATQRSRIGVIRRSGAHLLTLIDDLLDLSRIEHGRMPIAAQPFALRQAVAEVCDLLGATAREKGLAFSVRVAPQLPAAVVADAARVRQVLHNLVGNAIKFTREGAVDVRVDLDGNDGEPARLRFVVGDTGPGIAETDRERVFEPFEQAVGAGARGGTGLGLSISRELARAMGGNLMLRVSAGSGTEFVFTLPLVAASAAPAPAAEPDAGEPVPLTGNVLVVDDSPVNALVAQAVLERFGLTVTTAQHGGEALEWLDRRCFDLVLMDIQMPVLDGIETTRRWRALERSRGSARTPIVALTANAISSERDKCIAAGMDDYLVKPFEINALHRVVRQQLQPLAA
jgi:signal transduction histidine kinase/CheY-like chemotaxis protein